ncbi:yak1p [Saccharomyces arboricola H-6]|uniref:Yak1p n=1 Tax=Saccharomyces arboricola (strain H-6 / AS 2.3317 / CBS 10644) TaxID=1160507 RepID=J8Q0T8_SACAR|nr:yak1p [Saccharomyces arboricola H-6]
MNTSNNNDSSSSNCNKNTSLSPNLATHSDASMSSGRATQDSGYLGGNIWNPSYMNQASQRSPQQQQHLQQQHNQQFCFVNPWNEEKVTNSQQNLVYPPQYDDLNSNESLDAYRRRKSSLVVPPTRAAAPNPFQYDSYPAYTSSNTNLAANASGQYPSAYQQQQQQQQQQQHAYQQGAIPPSQFGSRFVPSLYNRQEFQRRQSLAATNYSSNFSSINSGANQGTSPIPAISSYRRLSAYPPSTSPPLQPPFKQLRRDEVQGQKLSIPQMQPCSSKNDLQPVINVTPKFRRASLNSKTISPLVSVTKSLITTYSLCSPDFTYQTSKNPKRVLTKPSEGKCNNGFDNLNSDYILYVNDVLGVEQNRKYLVLDILGQGTFGQVVKCQNLLTKEILAVKVVKSRTEYLTQSITEAKILELLNQKIDPANKHHFLRMHDSFVHKNHLCLVFELLSNNLYELLKQNKFHGLSMQLIRTFTTQILDSLCVLKESKLIHCDLKPENILLCAPDKPELKIIDFGSSCEEARTVYTYIQSRFYRAPEIILGIPYSTSIDMWSLGCIVAELFLGIPIFPGASEYNQLTRIIDTLGYPPSWMIDMGKNSGKFMKKLTPEESVISTQKHRMKTIEEFSREYNIVEKSSKQYFKWKKLPDIIRNYRYPKSIQNSEELIDQEMHNRECLIHFLGGVLDLNPLERWTPQQAMLHPFITKQEFTGEWFPPGSSLPEPSGKQDNTKGQQTDRRNSTNSLNHDYVYNSNIGNGGADSVDISTSSKGNVNVLSNFPNNYAVSHSVQEGPTNEFNKLHIVEE